MAARTVLRNISEIRRYFYRSETPVYFVSATNFNLLGMDDWVRGLQHINYLDCYDRRHPRVYSPSEAPHETFQSIEDINNYLLEHKEVVDLIRANGPGAKAVFLMFDARTEEICRELGLEVCFPPAKLRQEVDDKISGTRIGNRAGVESVPNALGKVGSYAELLALAAPLGGDLVVQTAFGDSGHTTFFINGEADYRRHAAEIEREAEVKVMKRIRCRQAAIEGCVTRAGTLVGPLMTELVGFPELTPYKGGWCGNEVLPGAFTPAIRAEARASTFRFGEELRRMGYRGYFELDFLVDLDSGRVYLGEINPRVTGASAMTNNAAFAHADAPLFLFHLLEHSDVDFELDVEALNQRWSEPESLDAWGQLVIKHTADTVDRLEQAPPTGVYRLEPDGGVRFLRAERDRRTVRGEQEAFFLRIAREGDWRYQGADLGILLTPGRLMDQDFALTARARAWTRGMLAHYRGAPPAPPEKPAPVPPAKLGRFKIM